MAVPRAPGFPTWWLQDSLPAGVPLRPTSVQLGLPSESLQGRGWEGAHGQRGAPGEAGLGYRLLAGRPGPGEFSSEAGLPGKGLEG